MFAPKVNITAKVEHKLFPPDWNSLADRPWTAGHHLKVADMGSDVASGVADVAAEIADVAFGFAGVADAAAGVADVAAVRQHLDCW